MVYTPDAALIQQYRVLHEQGKFRGNSLLRHAREIAKLVQETGANSLLDYGSGAGDQYSDSRCHLYWGGILPHLYDPGIPDFAIRPDGKFDGVICSDVAEHIPEEEIDEFLRDVFGYSGKFVFISICCRPARKTLLDGRNVHLTIRPEEWWEQRIEEVARNTGIIYRIGWNP